MIKLIYDYQVFSWQKYGGVSRYIYELATRICESNTFNVKILAMAYVNEYLKECKSGLVVGFPVQKLPKTGKIVTKVNISLSKFWLESNPPNIIHETYYCSQSLAPKKVKVVITVHDMLHEKLSQFFPRDKTSQEKVEAVKRADHIICVSENTKKDLIEILGVPTNKVSVVYHGYSFKFNESYQADNKKVSPYVLYVGDRGGYKNFQGFLRAYAISSQLRNNFNLVCFGSLPFSGKELSLINELDLPKGKILHIAGNDFTLANLYRGASVFIYPSLYEGFGIPLLEAMALHCPVACSNTSSMPEVAGNAAEFFDPYEPEGIADALERVLYSPERAENLVKLGIERIKRFSWEACAEQTRSIYLSML